MKYYWPDFYTKERNTLYVVHQALGKGLSFLAIGAGLLWIPLVSTLGYILVLIGMLFIFFGSDLYKNRPFSYVYLPIILFLVAIVLLIFIPITFLIVAPSSFRMVGYVPSDGNFDQMVLLLFGSTLFATNGLFLSILLTMWNLTDVIGKRLSLAAWFSAIVILVVGLVLLVPIIMRYLNTMVLAEETSEAAIQSIAYTSLLQIVTIIPSALMVASIVWTHKRRISF